MPKTPKQNFDVAARDARRWEILQSLQDEFSLTTEDILKNFPAFVRRRELPRFLAHYELFKMSADIPGVILDFGVFRGVSLITWAHLLETFNPLDRRRKVYGFDGFEGLGALTPEDGAEKASEDGEKRRGGYRAPQEMAATLADLFNEDAVIPNVKRVEIIVGEIKQTLPKFIADNPALRVSLLHLDLDLYEPTKFVLEQIFPLISRGGVIVFDEYAVTPWEGETRAVDEFFADRPEAVRRVDFAVTPGGYIIKH